MSDAGKDAGQFRPRLHVPLVAGLAAAVMALSIGAAGGLADPTSVVAPVSLGDHIHLCVPVGGSEPTRNERELRHLNHEQSIRAEGRAVTLTGFDFATQDGLRVVSVRLLRDPPLSTIGWVSLADPPSLWFTTVPAAGVTLEAGEQAFLEIEVEYLGPGDARMGALEVTFDVAGHTERVRDPEEMLLMNTSPEGCGT